MDTPRGRAAGRGFDRVDAAVLVAAFAAGLALAWEVSLERWTSWREMAAEAPAPFAVDAFCRVAGLLLAPLCLACLAACLRRAPPRRGRLFDRPGTWPGVACLVIVAANLLAEPLNLAILHAPPSWRRYLQIRACDVSGQQPIGQAVCVAWAVLWLCGRWRPEPSWVDRAGRALGVAAVALFLIGEMQTGISDLVDERRPAAAEPDLEPPPLPVGGD